MARAEHVLSKGIIQIAWIAALEEAQQECAAIRDGWDRDQQNARYSTCFSRQEHVFPP
jgi:hypothetical protein